MTEWSLDKLDEVIHAKARLGIMSILMTYEQCEFTFIKKKLGLTDGNLSTHIKKLEEADYISIEKLFVKKKPTTYLSVTSKGRKAFELYVSNVEAIIKTGTISKDNKRGV